MNMPDFYFLGTLDQYWKAIYAEYVRLTAILGDEPFSIAVSGELPFPISKYKPEIMDMILIQFADRKYEDVSNHRVKAKNKADQLDRLKFYGDCIVSVKATTILGMEQVNLDVDVYVDALKKSDGSVYARWQTIHDAWIEKGWLVNAHAGNIELAQMGQKNAMPPQPPTGSDSMTWLEWRFKVLKKLGWTYTLKWMAPKIPISYPRLRANHSLFKIQKSLSNGYEKRYKKRYKK